MPSAPTPRSRLFVLTDISEEEPDDLQSLIRLLLYSNEIEIEGLVATLSEWKNICGTSFRPDLIHQALNAYEKAHPQLLRHSAGYPVADELRALIAEGNGNDMTSTGRGHQTPGAVLLAEAILRSDPRPLWVGIWGGAATLAQAVLALQEKLPARDLQVVLRRTWVYEIQGQDDCGAWLAANHPSLNFIRSQYQWRGISNRVDGIWPESRRYLDGFVETPWFDEHIRQGHGPLGDLYPQARFLFEGDTPSLLHLIPNGLHEPESISQGGWGGRFLSEPRRNVWSGGCPVNNEGRFSPFPMFTDAADALLVAGNGKLAWNVLNPIRRWRDAYQNDFAARMDWCVAKPEACNHAPCAVVDQDHTLRVMRRPARQGSVLTLNASESADRAGQPLSFKWWIYAEAGAAGSSIVLESPQSAVCSVRVPEDSVTGEAHIILEVANEGPPPLRAYRRIILDVA